MSRTLQIDPWIEKALARFRASHKVSMAAAEKMRGAALSDRAADEEFRVADRRARADALALAIMVSTALEVDEEMGVST